MRIVLVLKKSPYQIYFLEQKNRVFLKHRAGEEDVERMKQSHAEHTRTIEALQQELSDAKVSWRAVYRADRFQCRAGESIVTIGGDGTFLEASHRIRDQWILGVNSDPANSVGHFCAANRNTFPSFLKTMIAGNPGIRSLNRIEVEVNGKSTGIPVLNEILIAHAIPAAMSRYVLRIGDITEEHRSSGVWLSTAAGSTAAIYSAGGRPLPERSRKLQYLPRELFVPPGRKYALRGGIIAPRKIIEIQSLMRDGRYYMDGSHLRFVFQYGDVLRIRNSDNPLQVIYTP